MRGTVYVLTPFGLVKLFIYRFYFSVIISIITIGNLLFSLLWLKKNPILFKSIKSESNETPICQKCEKKINSKEVFYPTILHLEPNDYNGLVLRENLFIRFINRNSKKDLKLYYFTLQGDICQTCFDRISFLLKKQNKRNQVFLIALVIFCISLWVFSIRWLFQFLSDYIITGWFTGILLLISSILEMSLYDKYRQVYLKILKNRFKIRKFVFE